MKELSESGDIIFNKSNRGGVITIAAVKGYRKEAERQLNNAEIYRKL